MRTISLALLLSSALTAQLRFQHPPPAIPVVPPPVNHPAYAAQPLIEQSSPTVTVPAPMPTPAQKQPEKTPAERAAEAFRGKQVKGAELKKAVDKVLKGLHWYGALADAEAAAAASGKPVLWIQALGDVNGFT